MDPVQGEFELTCTFLVGSIARGCFLFLSGTFGNYSMPVERNGTTAVHRNRVDGPLGAFSYSVFDWEEDGTVANISVPMQTSVNATLELPTNITGIFCLCCLSILFLLHCRALRSNLLL